MNKLLILIILIGSTLDLIGQQQVVPIHKKANCQSKTLMQQNLRQQPFLMQKRTNFLRKSKRWIADQANATEQKLAKVIHNIPTVVHVVYANAIQNISDAQIQSQIQVLNEDFSLSNPDFGLVVPAVFQSSAADIEFNFCLAQIDPDGNTSTGITRTMTTVSNIGNSNSSAIFYTTNGGKNSWDDSRYLNIYVCEIDDNGQFLGYATLPGSALSGEDGIVIDYKYFGTTGTVAPPLDKGRTATHEIGHYFNLEHIWGNGCNSDDDVADTPEQENSYGGCPVHPRTSCGSDDMFMNYMDYVNDDCMAFFTEGQKARMHAALNTARNGLLNNSAACGTASTLASNDILNWQLYPNPSDRNTVSIHFESNQLEGALVLLRNINGIVYTSSTLQQNLQIDVSPLPSGIYTVEIIHKKSRMVKKLILR